MTILDISKTVVYDFRYNYIHNNTKLLYTDTDSLIYQFFVDGIYEHIKEDIHKFNTSMYPCLRNKKVLGIMKDGCCGIIILEFIYILHTHGIYSMKIIGNSNETEEKIIKRVKGIKTFSVKKISFDDYY